MLKIGIWIALVCKIKSVKYKIVLNKWQRKSRHGTVGAFDAKEQTRCLKEIALEQKQIICEKSVSSLDFLYSAQVLFLMSHSEVIDNGIFALWDHISLWARCKNSQKTYYNKLSLAGEKIWSKTVTEFKLKNFSKWLFYWGDII